MNLYLTHKCNRGCPFCFARKVLKEAHINGHSVDEILSIRDITTLLDRFPGEFRSVGLLGGEPFLYPYWDELLELFKQRNVYAKIFTSATNTLPESLEKISIEEAVHRMNFVVNVGVESSYNPKQRQNLEHFFEKFAPCSLLSFTIFDLTESPTWVFDLIDKYQLQRNVRVGIALPIYKGGNSYIPLSDYRKAGDYFVAAAEKANAREIRLSMDCGFVACMFSEEQIGQLQLYGADLNFVCGSAIDIGPDLQTWNCFPLFQLGQINIMDFPDVESLREHFARRNREMLGGDKGVFDECSSCKLYAKHLCEGGCKSFKSLEYA